MVLREEVGEKGKSQSEFTAASQRTLWPPHTQLINLVDNEWQKAISSPRVIASQWGTQHGFGRATGKEDKARGIGKPPGATMKRKEGTPC